MTEHKIHSGIIEAVQCMLFYQIVDSHIEILMFDVRNTVYQFVEYRQQHDSREIGNHQTDGDGKGLVEEDRSCYSAHEHKRNEDGNCRKVELSIGVITSVVPLLQASSSESPRVLYWVMFSVTMIELSIIIPKARINPEMEMIFSDILQR